MTARRERLFRIHANRIVAVCAGHVDVQLSIRDVNAESLAPRGVGHACKNAAIRAIGPGRKRESVFDIEGCLTWNIHHFSIEARVVGVVKRCCGRPLQIRGRRPLRQASIKRLHPRFGRCNLRVESIELLLLLIGRRGDERRRVAILHRATKFGNVVEVGENLIELFLRERIVLVIVAARAA